MQVLDLRNERNGKMKKIVSIILSVLMSLQLGITVFASEWQRVRHIFNRRTGNFGSFT